tara:strand:+ start:193 stop:366 length:174 start_codon:yes stop_codon:yes gene_type:complete
MKESKQELLREVLKMEVESAIDNALNKFYLNEFKEENKRRKQLRFDNRKKMEKLLEK